MLSGRRPRDKTRMNETTRHTPVPDSVRTASLGSLFLTFLKIGSTAFGGFMALISVVQNYVVERRKLISHEEMLDGVSLATILPGPVAVNVVAYVGYRMRGWLGALVSAGAVILPSFLLLVCLSYAYFRFGQMPAVGRFFMGFIPAVTGIILVAAWNMGKKTIKRPTEAVITAAAFGLLIGLGGFVITVAIIGASGLAGWLMFRGKAPANPAPAKSKQISTEAVPGARRPRSNGVLAMLLTAPPLWSLNLTAAGKLLVTFGGMSLLLFGGGYVFIPLIQQIVVDDYGWVSRQEFIDAIALGQVTPGPILISAAFIGYKVSGLLGAAAATVGIFTPPAVVMIVSSHFLDRIRQSAAIQAGLRGIRSAVIGMIAASALMVGKTAPIGLVALFIFVASVIALLRFKVETALIIPVAGVAGLVFY